MTRPSDPRRRQSPPGVGQGDPGAARTPPARVGQPADTRSGQSWSHQQTRDSGRGGRPDQSGRRVRPVGQSTLWSDPDRGGPQPLRAAWTPIPSQDPDATQTRLRPRRPAVESTPPQDPGTGTRRKSARRRSALGWFVHRYGWRAYALPVLVALTVVVIVQVAKGPIGPVLAGEPAVTTSQQPAISAGSVSVPTTVVVTRTQVQTAPNSASAIAPASPSPSSSLPTAPSASSASLAGPDPNGEYAKTLKAGDLPVGAAFTAKGAGSYHVVPGRTGAIGSGPEKLTFTVEVEDGVQTTAEDNEFAASVVATLSDPRSWIASGQYTLQRVDTGTPSFRVSLSSQMTTRAICGYTIKLEASCYNSSSDNRVVINDSRWTRGAISFNGDLGSYRVYAINHEVGHRLGFHHQPCTEQGGLAPVMMQQSFSTANDDLHPLDVQNIPEDGLVCKFNPYPYPRGSTG